MGQHILKHWLRGKRGAVDLQHVLLEDEMLAPLAQEIGLDRTSCRSVVVQPSNA